VDRTEQSFEETRGRVSEKVLLRSWIRKNPEGIQRPTQAHPDSHESSYRKTRLAICSHEIAQSFNLQVRCAGSIQ